MAVSLLGLPTWMTIQLDPDGTGGPIGRRLTVGLVSTSLVIGSAGLLLTGGSDVLAAVLSVLGIAVAAAFATYRRPRWLLAAHVLLRTWLVVAAAGLYTRRRPEDVRLIWVTVLVLAIVIAGEPVLRRVLGVSRVFVAHLPGVPDREDLLAPVRAIPLSVLGSALAGELLAAFRVSAWAWLALAALTAGLAGAVTVSAARQLLADRHRQAVVARAVRAYAPELAIYTAWPDDASYQVTMWLPYFKRTGRPFVIITRNELPARLLAELTDVPVLCCRTIPEVEATLVPSLTTVFYVNASSGNGHMVRHSHLTHVHLGHGDSDKATSYNPTHAMYDKVFSAGEAAIARYAAHGVHIPREHFSVVGRPQVEGIARAAGPIAEVPAPTVLYAPTWRGHVDETALYSLPYGEQIVSALLARGVRVVFRPHPFTYSSPEDVLLVKRIHALLAEDAQSSGLQHVYGPAAETDLTIVDCFNLSDVMFSDVSSVVSDYLYSGKPLAVYAAGPSTTDFVDEFPVTRAGYLLAHDVSNLDEVLALALETDPGRQQRDDMRRYYLGDFPAETYADVFVGEVDRLVAGVGIERGARIEDLDEGGGDAGEEAAGAHGATGIGTATTADAASPDEDDDEDGATGEGGRTPGRKLTARGRLLRSGGYAILDGTSAVTAAASAFCALDGLATTATIVFAALSIGWMCVARPPWRQRSKTSMLGAFPVQRALLFVAIASITLRDPGVTNAGTAILLALLALTTVLEMWCREVLEVPRLRTVNLPTLSYSPTAWALHSAVYPSSIALLVLELALAPAGLIVLMLVFAAAATVVLAVLLARDLVLLRSSQTAQAELRQALEDYDPRFAVYFAATADSAYQMAMWAPYFERIGRRFIVVTRAAETLGPLAELTDAPIVLCRTLGSLEETLTSHLTTVFYVNNGLKNTHYIERRELTHIWLNHGDSEKPACFNPVHAIYDKIFTAGQAGVDRYARHGVSIAPEKFEVVGRPQVEAIDVVRSGVAAQADSGSGSGSGSEGGAGRTVLYAPTWVGPFADSNVYSLPVGEQIVAGLLGRGCRVVFRAHPLNYAYGEAVGYMERIWALLEADRASTGREHLWGEPAEKDLSFEGCANLSDAMVADVSAVVSDYLYSEKPFSIVAMDGNSEQLVATAPVAVAAYVLAGDLSNLDAVLEDLLVTDPLAEQRRRTKAYYLGDAPAETYVDGFLSAARRHIDRPSLDRLPPQRAEVP